MKLQLVANYEANCRGTLGRFLKNSEKNFKNEIFEQCHSAEKCKKRDPLGFFYIHCAAKYRNKRRRPFGGIQKKFKKSRIVPKKIRVKNTKEGILCFRGSGRPFWTSVVHFDDVEQMNKKVRRTRLKKPPTVIVGLIFYSKCAD